MISFQDVGYRYRSFVKKGAKYTAFVESDKAALECIKSNLKHTKLDSQAEIYPMKVLEAIRALEIKGKVFDIVFMDPPYNSNYEQDVLFALQKSNIIYCDTIIVVEASKQTSFDFLKDTQFRVFKKKEYKTINMFFLKKHNR